MEAGEKHNAALGVGQSTSGLCPLRVTLHWVLTALEGQADHLPVAGTWARTRLRTMDQPAPS
jgi:hypothetical protein